MADNIPKTTAPADAAAVKVSNEVYKATAYVEQLEIEGHLLGNGHHMRQEIAAFAANLVRSRWKAKQ